MGFDSLERWCGPCVVELAATREETTPGRPVRHNDVGSTEALRVCGGGGKSRRRLISLDRIRRLDVTGRQGGEHEVRLAATRNAVVAFELRAVELVRHTISGPARQAWTATRIQRPEEALFLDRRGLDGQF